MQDLMCCKTTIVEQIMLECKVTSTSFTIILLFVDLQRHDEGYSTIKLWHVIKYVLWLVYHYPHLASAYSLYGGFVYSWVFKVSMFDQVVK